MPTPVMQQFAYGPVSPIVALTMSLIGAAFGLACVARAHRSLSQQHRVRWILCGSIAIGGIGIWLTHFMAMVGFDVASTQIRYNLPMAGVSLAVALGLVTAGLFVACSQMTTKARILLGGPLVGIGVAATHYTGMAAVRLGGTLTYDRVRFAASVLIAIVGASLALWLALSARRARRIGVAAVVFALTVGSMQYVALLALHVHLRASVGLPPGVNPTALIMPIVVIAIMALLAMLFAGLTMMSDDDIALPTGRGAHDDGIPTAIPFTLASPFGADAPGVPGHSRHAR